MSFAVDLGFSAFGYSLCAAYFFAWQEKRDLLSFFLRFFFTVGYFLLNSSLSLSLQRKVRIW
jgi:hypothetical protein